MLSKVATVRLYIKIVRILVGNMLKSSVNIIADVKQHISVFFLCRNRIRFAHFTVTLIFRFKTDATISDTNIFLQFPYVCHLLYLLTRREDITLYRVRALLDLQQRKVLEFGIRASEWNWS